jgi:hypothetical protein
MSADIEKLAVFDGRIVQQRPKYAVEKGALSVTNAPFNAIAATPSQHTYNIYVPSENVFVDRGMEWSSTVFLKYNILLTPASAPGLPISEIGRDVALCALPLNSLCSTLTATINDTTSVINSQDVLKEVLRLTDYKENRLQRTCPTALDVYQQYSDGSGTINDVNAGFQNQTDYEKTPNGAFAGLFFTDGVGTPLMTYGGGTGNSGGVVVTGATYACVNGIPCAPAAGFPAAATVTVFCAFRSTEKLVLSPFTFADSHEWDTGLFGINNIQLIMNLRAPSRILRATQPITVPASGITVVPGSIDYNGAVQGGQVFQNSVVNAQFLTPSLDVPLPPKSVVPYMEFPRFISQPGTTIQPGGTAQLVSQTITLPQIPDLFIIYAKPPAETLPPQQADWYLPVATALDGVRNPLSVNFDNFSGLLSSVTAEQLYQMSVHNGLDMDWNQWSGYGTKSALAGNSAGVPNALGYGRVPLTGGFLVLKPSQDITLQTGQAPSLVGNFTFQFQLTVKNTTAAPVTPQLYVITANSGFFESIRGSSRIIKGVLSEQDIISAPLAPMGTRTALARFVGGAMKGMATVLSKTPSLMSAKGDGMGAAVGAGGAVGAAMTGAAVGAGRKKSGMVARLM